MISSHLSKLKSKVLFLEGPGSESAFAAISSLDLYRDHRDEARIECFDEGIERMSVLTERNIFMAQQILPNEVPSDREVKIMKAVMKKMLESGL
jgi:hypothetical protein